MAKPRQIKSKAKKIKGAHILVVESRFYDDISEALYAGATRTLKEAAATWDRISVPGSLEIPTAVVIALEAAERKRKPYDGVVALGCVIQGETFHFDIVAMQSARALMDLSITHRMPIGNGILTVDTEAQAWARARPEQGNKGGDAARAALALVEIKRMGAKLGAKR